MKIAQFLTNIFLPGKVYNQRMREFNDKFKKDYYERTSPEKIICESFFYINFSGKNDMRYYGALEATLILEGYIEPGKSDFFKQEGYQKTIYKLSEKYLKDKNIL